MEQKSSKKSKIWLFRGSTSCVELQIAVQVFRREGLDTSAQTKPLRVTEKQDLLEVISLLWPVKRVLGGFRGQ